MSVIAGGLFNEGTGLFNDYMLKQEQFNSMETSRQSK